MPKKNRKSMTDSVASKNATATRSKSTAEPSGSHRSKFMLTLIPILLGLMVASLVYRIPGPWLRREASVQRPDVLLNYGQFRALYPRLREARPVENSRRHLLFIGDLIRVGAQNISYLAGGSGGSADRLARQTPFRSDRTLPEQHDILGQMEEFNMTQIMLNFKLEQASEKPLDVPVSLAGSGHHQAAKTSTLKTGSKVGKWLKLTVQGDSHFEIPNFPLDGQHSDGSPDRITHIDADQRHCSGGVHNQGHCGACYAFSWISLAEWHHCKQSGNHRIDFSEQHLLDCGHLVGLTGCREGYLKDAMRFSDKFGFHLEQEYPYRGKQASVCSRKEGNVRVRVVEFTRLQVNRSEWERVLYEQPILLQVHLPKDIMSYHRGIHHGLNCDESKAHGMLLVGHGRELGQPYWILKNSMGPHWGEMGYLRLSRDAPINECFRTGFVAKFKFESLDQEAYYDLYDGDGDDSIKFEPSVHVIPPAGDDGKISKQALKWFKGANDNDN